MTAMHNYFGSSVQWRCAAAEGM